MATRRKRKMILMIRKTNETIREGLERKERSKHSEESGTGVMKEVTKCNSACRCYIPVPIQSNVQYLYEILLIATCRL